MENKKKIFYGWWVVLGIMTINALIVPAILTLSNMYLVQITEEMQISRAAFTLTNTILQGLGIFLSPYIGKKLSTSNFNRFMTGNLILFCLGYASYAAAQNVYWFYVSAIFVGIGYLSTTMIATGVLIANWFVERRGIAMSIAVSGISLGGFVFSPIVTYLISHYGWRVSYVLHALIVLVVGLPIILFVLRRSPEEKGLRPYGSKDAAEQKASAGASAPEGWTFAEAKKSPILWALLAGYLCSGLMCSGALGQFPPALQDAAGMTVAAAIVSTYSLIGIFSKFVYGWITDKFGLTVGIAYGCLFFMASFLILAFTSNVTMLYVMSVTFALGNPMGSMTSPLLTASIFKGKQYGQAYGYATSIMNIGNAFGSLIIASFFDVTGSYRMGWFFATGLAIAILFLWTFAYKAGSAKANKAVAE